MDPIESGQQFGKFILQKRLGAGGMGEVFLAHMVGPAGFLRRVAVKRLLPHLAEDQQFTNSFVSEARLGGSLNHPNIVQTIELGRHDESYYLAMEFVEGATLFDLIQYHRRRRSPLPLSIVLNITRQICEALAYAHSAHDARGTPLNMIHRDLKPANILLSLFGVVKLTDFGVARADSNLQRTMTHGALKGTLGYMSPEQASCEELDARSDLYSVGSILFEMLTLEPLFLPLGVVKQLRLVKEGNLEDRLAMLAPFPPNLVSLVRRLLAKDREHRPATAADVNRELQAISFTIPMSTLEIGDLVREAQDGIQAAEAAHPTRLNSPVQSTIQNVTPMPSPPGPAPQPPAHPVPQLPSPPAPAPAWSPVERAILAFIIVGLLALVLLMAYRRF